MTKRALIELLVQYDDDTIVCRADSDWSQVLVTSVEFFVPEFFSESTTYYVHGVSKIINDPIIVLR